MKLKLLLWGVALLALSTMALAQTYDFTTVNYNPAPAQPGKSVDFFIQFQNTSNQDSVETVFELDLFNASKTSTYPFSFPSDQTAKKSVGLVKAGQGALVKYTILVDSGAPNGNYAVQLGVGSNGIVSKKVPYMVSIVARDPQVEIIQSSTSPARPGELSNVTLSIKNIGGGKAFNVLIGVPEERVVTASGAVIEREVKLVGSNVYVPSLEIDEEKQVVVPLSVDSSAELKTYLIPFKITFQNSDRKEFTLTRTVGLKVTSEPVLDTTLASANPLPVPGKSSEFSFELFNIGKGTASNTIVEFYSPAIAEWSQEKIFIGTLESDDFDSFKARGKIRGDWPVGTPAPITLRLAYKNADGKDFTVEKTIQSKVVSASESKAQNGTADNTVPAVVVGLIVLGGAYWWWNRNSKRKQSNGKR